ncbi:MAG TPA: ERF family protein [Pseudoxanthomonas sp.]
MPDTAVSETIEIDFARPLPDDLNVPVPGVPPHQAVAVPTSGDPFLMMIERAASDPRVDIDKMDRLLQMKERRDAKEAQVEYDRAMADAQEGMRPVRANLENPQTRSEYADYSALDKAVRPIYARHGFSLSFSTAEGAPDNCIRIVCTVAHRSGHRERPHLDMPADGKGARGNDVMTKTHATGAAITYGKRYLLGMIFNLAVTRDDDGNGASGDDDVERLGTGPRGADGRLMSNYSAQRAEQAKLWADAAIQTINLTNNAEAVREWARVSWTVPAGKKKSPLQWLSDNSPGQFTRVANAYQNVTGDELE